MAFPPGSRPPRSFGSARRAARSPSLHVELPAWRRALEKEAAAASTMEAGDVANCYGSIDPAVISRASRAQGGDPSALLTCLDPVWERGIVGLPIGPSPSSYIADRLLGPADDAAGAAGVRPLRWVDDVVFLGDPGAVERAARAWRAALGELGLRAHEGKRRLVRIHQPLSTLSLDPSHTGGGAHGIIRLP
jgi:hypothetical protein